MRTKTRYEASFLRAYLLVPLLTSKAGGRWQAQARDGRVQTELDWLIALHLSRHRMHCHTPRRRHEPSLPLSLATITRIAPTLESLHHRARVARQAGSDR